MDQEKEETAKDSEHVDLLERKLIIAYLSYALDDVRMLGGAGLEYLQMAIAEIAGEPSAANFDRPQQSPLPH
jgi:hypothetical protein